MQTKPSEALPYHMARGKPQDLVQYHLKCGSYSDALTAAVVNCEGSLPQYDTSHRRSDYKTQQSDNKYGHINEPLRCTCSNIYSLYLLATRDSLVLTNVAKKCLSESLLSLHSLSYICYSFNGSNNLYRYLQ